MNNVHWFRYPAIAFSITGLTLWLVVFLNKFAPECEWWETVMVVLFSLLVAAFVASVPDLANVVAQFLGDRFAAIMMPDEKYDKPPLTYRLARKFSRQGRLNEAMEEYLLIIRYYPEEEDAHRELIHVAEQLGDRRLLDKTQARLKKLLRKKTAKR
jgi:tetratricopeptide (TPR) repeat protein